MIKTSSLINAAIQQGLVTPEQMMIVKKEARRLRQDLLESLSIMHRVPVSSIYRAYAELHNMDYVTGKGLNIDMKALKSMPTYLVQKRLIVPIVQGIKHDHVIFLAITDPEDHSGIEQAKRALNSPVEIVLTNPEELRYALSKAVSKPFAQSDIQFGSEAFDPVDVLDRILKEAYLHRASDIHLEPRQDLFQVRLRIDGHLKQYPFEYRTEEGQALISRMKVLAHMDISEQRYPQDGSFTFNIKTAREFDIRAATMPTRFGERATLRILGSETEKLTLDNIGMGEGTLHHFRKAIEKSHGMVLLTGPTGSGKSTTLYAALREIAREDINILTVEDPVEYAMEGIAQVQISTKVSFASALRGFLRHDPDVIMVGEIRDNETADIAVKSAMTGHLVFSTLHTNDAVSAIGRLADLGVERYLIGSTLLCVIAQRLVRCLCSLCKEPIAASAEENIGMSLQEDAATIIFRPRGCAHCMGTGYKGRTALYETLWLDEKTGHLIQRAASESEITEHATAHLRLADDGRDKVLKGITSMEELKKLGLCNAAASPDKEVA
ncbi:MAG: type II/IV secretion system protein [Nitrospira sp.]|nr:type II/IV secretion system protein [bacterium]MBL7048315.1 type II/IV secretion system protein [Nitrospira sp.]